jgi:predicted RNase H-like HicB family nuclease
MSHYHVVAEWDAEGSVWIASSEDVPGLSTGAETLATLLEKLKTLVPELLVENEILPVGTGSVPIEIRVQITE